MGDKLVTYVVFPHQEHPRNLPCFSVTCETDASSLCRPLCDLRNVNGLKVKYRIENISHLLFVIIKNSIKLDRELNRYINVLKIDSNYLKSLSINIMIIIYL